MSASKIQLMQDADTMSEACATLYVGLVATGKINPDTSKPYTLQDCEVLVCRMVVDFYAWANNAVADASAWPDPSAVPTPAAPAVPAVKPTP